MESKVTALGGVWVFSTALLSPAQLLYGKSPAAGLFPMEAPGIEPGSRDVSMLASTCVVALLHLADRARSDTVRHGQPDQVSRQGNRATPCR